MEQLIYTAQAAVQARAPVQFFLGENPIDQVFGVPTSEPLAEGKWSDVLSLMSVTAPEEGATVSGSFEASGVASSFEANVQWQITQNGETVKDRLHHRGRLDGQALPLDRRRSTSPTSLRGRTRSWR